MMDRKFSLSSREQVARFEELANSYLLTRTRVPLAYPSLVSFFDYCTTRSDGSKLFAAALDVFLNYVALHMEMSSLGGTWNDNFSITAESQKGSILDSEHNFFGKLDLLRHQSSFVLRYRAIWEKIFGLLLLIYAPQMYEVFSGAKRKTSRFLTYAKDIKEIPANFCALSREVTTRFDQTFRTPESHGTGSLRKWTLLMEAMDQNPQMQLIGYWNVLNESVRCLKLAIDASSPNPLEAAVANYLRKPKQPHDSA
ncbi:hypothetical protein [Lysobacter sp. CFH 32150]|uniref:hypothetical protein n=1 Tax=Lysobacter sp. CFH 32150 TaxID=2927128 RepID=UPI001FA7802C|nr:hypothetical protein [Lysobacter sp. CFH 32150]MCI4566354.1 hypothetical protein [Lysobacter sp. CFH 32150]